MMGRRALKYEPLKDSYQFLHPTFSTYEDRGGGKRKDMFNLLVSYEGFRYELFHMILTFGLNTKIGVKRKSGVKFHAVQLLHTTRWKRFWSLSDL